MKSIKSLPKLVKKITEFQFVSRISVSFAQNKYTAMGDLLHARPHRILGGNIVACLKWLCM